MSGLIHLYDYYKERFTKVPWFFLPFILSLWIKPSFELSMLTTILYLFLALIFYRLFDDLMMEAYDKAKYKERRYFAHTSSLKKIIILPVSVYLAATYILFDEKNLIATLVFLGFNLILYKLLKTKKLSLFISILKYPFITYIYTYSVYLSSVLFFLFMISELADEKIINISKSYFYIFIMIIFFLRLIGSYL